MLAQIKFGGLEFPADMSILAINSGSSSLKFGLYDDAAQQALLSGHLDWAGGDRQHAQLWLKTAAGRETRSVVSAVDDTAAARRAVDVCLEHSPEPRASRINAVGHRVVHGGTEYCRSARVDGRLKQVVAGLGELAPLHNPPALRAIEAVELVLPGVPQVAVFDTAFCAGLPRHQVVYPLPYRWHEEWGIRRFGFHGISNSWCALRAAEMLGHPGLRLITCHLGSGCSATAVRAGAAAATTMGFSPLEGLVMGTRCGSVDPGILLHVQRRFGLGVAELDHALNRESGLLGLSGVSPDLGAVEAAAAAGNERAQLAFDVFADRVRSAIGALTVSLGGLDALVFTDRIGESSPALRAAVCQDMEFLGLRLDVERNRACHPDADVAQTASPARILVIKTQEELMIARETCRVAFGSN